MNPDPRARISRAAFRQRAGAAGLGLAILAGDLASKALARSSLTPGRPVRLAPGLDLERGENSGVAFGLLSGSRWITPVLLAVGACALVGLARSTAWARWWAPVGLTVGGGTANLLDRAGDGHVSDFIHITHWPPFNLADVAITAGLLLFALKRNRPNKAPARASGVDAAAGRP